MNVVLLDLPSPPEGGGDEPFAFGGSQVVTAGLVRALLESEDVGVFVFTPASRRSLFRRRLAGYRHGNRAALLDAGELREAAADSDVVLQGLTTSLVEGIHLRWLCGSPNWPVVGMTHDLSDLGVFREVLLTAIGRPQPFDAIVCSTACARGVVSRLFASVPADLRPALDVRLPVIPLGVDTRAFAANPDPDRRKRLGLPEGRPVALYLGRLSSRMKADLRPLLQAFSLAPAEHRAVLVVAGGVSCPADREDVEQLSRRASELGLAEALLIRPNVSLQERADLLAAADVLVSPPDCMQESFGVVLLEGMASGLPIIAADWDGYREVLDAPSCGLLVPTLMPPDVSGVSRRAPLEEKPWWYSELSQTVSVDVPALAAALAALLGDEDARRRAGENGLRRARDLFDWPVVVRKYVALWGELAAAARGAEPPGPSPFWYDHTRVFAEHPTRRLRADTVLRRTPAGEHPASLVGQAPAFLSRATLEELLECLARPSRLGHLPGDPEKVARHVAYLLKHGLAEELSHEA